MAKASGPTAKPDSPSATAGCRSSMCRRPARSRCTRPADVGSLSTTASSTTPRTSGPNLRASDTSSSGAAIPTPRSFSKRSRSGASRLQSRSSTEFLRSPCGIAGSANSGSFATGSASSRCTGRGCRTARSCSAPSFARCGAIRISARRSSHARLRRSCARPAFPRRSPSIVACTSCRPRIFSTSRRAPSRRCAATGISRTSRRQASAISPDNQRSSLPMSWSACCATRSAGRWSPMFRSARSCPAASIPRPSSR